MASAQYFANTLGDPRSLYALAAMVPAIFFVSVMSAYRGYFQGLQEMLPYALSQILEQVARVAVALGLGVYLLQQGYALEIVAGGVSLGVTIGSIAGLIVLLLYYSRRKADILARAKNSMGMVRENTSNLLKEMLALAIPITVGGLVVSLMLLIDAVVVPRRLQVAGFSLEQSTALYGQLSGMASPLVNLPQMVTVAVVASLVPAISEALSLKRKQLILDRSNMAMRLSMLWNMPAAVGLSLLAAPVAILLYGSNAAGVGVPLAVLAYTVVFLAVQQTTTGILQGLGKAHLPVISIAVGATVKLVLSYTLTAIPVLHVRGAAMATVLAFAASAALNLVAVTRCRIKLDWDRIFFRPALATIGMGFAVGYVQQYVVLGSSTLTTVLSLVVGGITYGVLALAFGAISISELQNMVGGVPK